MLYLIQEVKQKRKEELKMNVEKLVIELKENGFKVIDKGEELRLIKNKKAMNYNKEKFEAMESNSKRNELNIIIRTF